jgi:hypothetical protein
MILHVTAQLLHMFLKANQGTPKTALAILSQVCQRVCVTFQHIKNMKMNSWTKNSDFLLQASGR